MKFFLFFISCFFLTGCFEIREEVNMKADGSGEETLLALDEAQALFANVKTSSKYYVKAQFFSGITSVRQRKIAPAVKAFDDRILHYDATNPLGSVIHPNTGTIIEVRSISALESFMQVQVRPAK